MDKCQAGIRWKPPLVEAVREDAAPETFAWTIPALEAGAISAGDYRFYARWPAANDNAADARYTVTHAGGSSSVTRNQQSNGGQWNLLGSYALAAGQAWRVDLSDQAHGNVVADAVYVVRDDAAPETFAWTIPALDAGTIPAGSYAVYARWAASSVNSSAAVYTVAHAGGTASVTVNQKQNGGQWRLLGTYNFAPGAGHQVSLAAAADGRVVADAIRLVAVGGPAADIVYIHPDQLGSPQKMTDALKAVVWDRQAGPFGELETIAGLAAMPLRFPGQYADAESSFSYNYYRDYDPALGRYIESDPIGLLGGLNTYGYVGGNPVTAIDPRGLDLILVGEPGKLGDLLKLAARTWDRENPCDCNEIKEVGSGEEALDAMEAYAKKHNGIDGLQIFAHSGPQGIFFDTSSSYASLYSGGVGWLYSLIPGDQARIESIEPDWFRPDATAQLFGCRAAEGDSSLAQALATLIGIPWTGSQSSTHFSPHNVRSDYKGPVHMVPDSLKNEWRTFYPQTPAPGPQQ